jgi:inorganic pyrophosphatase
MKILLSVIAIVILISCSQENKKDITQIATHDFLRDFPAYATDSLVNIVVEIPAGCNQKWEVNKINGFMEWESSGEDSLRIVKYLPYPANYGMIPSTWLPEQEGGDNDPMDVFLLGQTVDRGSVLPARIIGLIRILDKGLQDDKLIAVTTNDWFFDIHDIPELNEKYPGIIQILTTWLLHYKGSDTIEIQRIENASTAKHILHQAINAYNCSGGIIH